MYVHAGRDVNKPSMCAALCAERALFMAVTACVSSELLFFLLAFLSYSPSLTRVVILPFSLSARAVEGSLVETEETRPPLAARCDAKHRRRRAKGVCLSRHSRRRCCVKTVLPERRRERERERLHLVNFMAEVASMALT